MKNIACPTCSASVSEPYLRAYDLNWRTSAEGFSLVRCTACGTVYLTPAPEEGELDKYYPPRYYTRASGAVEVTEAVKRGMEAGFRYRLRTLSSLGPAGTMLDIGCGDGHFISFMRRQHWDAWGVEISTSACSYAVEKLGLPPDRVICGDILKAPLPAGRFDLITMYDVLEHLPDPGAVIGACEKLLKPGGYIFIQVPNIDSLGRRLLGPYWIHLDAPRHISHYGVKTLRLLFRGWEDVQAVTRTDTGIPYIPGYSDSFRRWLWRNRPAGEPPGPAAPAGERVTLLRRTSRLIERGVSKLIGRCADMAGAGEMVQLYARKRT